MADKWGVGMVSFLRMTAETVAAAGRVNNFTSPVASALCAIDGLDVPTERVATCLQKLASNRVLPPDLHGERHL